MSRLIVGVFCVFVTLMLWGCVVDNDSAQDPSPDGGVDCSAECSADECPSGEVLQTEDCRCVCTPICEEGVCEECGPGEVAVSLPGSCCPSCVLECQNANDCDAASRCSEGRCVPSCENIECAACPNGWIAGFDDTSCCSCRPACGPNSPYTCAQGERCYEGLCRAISDECLEVECQICPPGTTPVESTDDDCCPSCEPGCECPAIYAPVCAAGLTFDNECLAECQGLQDYEPGLCADVQCEIGSSCDATCEAIENCFISECGSIRQRGLLRDGCSRECGVSEELTERVCSFENCVDVVDLVTDLSGQDFCGDSIDCDDLPPNAFYFGYGDECDMIPRACDEEATYFRDECGCGCIYGTPENCEEFAPPGVTYLEFGDACEFANFSCDEGSDYWFDDCGCGCAELQCGCPEFEAPVCGPDGQVYVNECEANCVGIFEARPCEMACECDGEPYEPVCGLDGQTYDNACIAECLSVPLVQEGSCYETDLCANGFESSCEEACAVALTCYTELCDEEEARIIEAECGQFCRDGAPIVDTICGFSTCEEVVGVLGPITGRDNACTVNELGCPDPQVAQYYGFDPLTCQLFEFSCEAGTTAFDNFCGCGCAPEDPCPLEGRNATYISRDSEVCSRITLNCPDGSEAFSDDCGCGCTY